MKLKDLTLKQFLEKIASREPVPGGGTGLAFSMAMATALIEMMANFTIGKENYKAQERLMREAAAEMAENRALFISDIDGDADSYMQLLAAYRLPKESSRKAALAKERVREAGKKATLVQMELAERAFGLLDRMIEVVQKGNRNLVADGAVGVMLCITSIEGALLNVRTNLADIDDKRFVAELSERCDFLQRDIVAKELDSTNYFM